MNSEHLLVSSVLLPVNLEHLLVSFEYLLVNSSGIWDGSFLHNIGETIAAIDNDRMLKDLITPLIHAY